MTKNTHRANGTPRKLKSLLITTIADHLRKATGASTETAQAMVHATFLATGHRSSITDACEEHPLLHPDTYFDHARNLAPAETESIIQHGIEETLALAKSEGVLPEEVVVAIDLHVDPDYSKNHAGCIGYGKLPGTNYGMAYMSTESVTAPVRFTFAAHPIRAATDRAAIFRNQLETTLRWVKISRVYVDRGFYAVSYLNVLSDLKLPFVVPVPASERIKRLKEEAWRRRIRIPGTPYAYHVVPEYVIHENKKDRQSATVQLVFFFEPDSQDPSRDVCFVFATEPGNLGSDEIVDRANGYRERFGIESGYRSKNALRVRTSSSHYATRLFLQLFSVLAYNLWTLLRALRARATGRIHPRRKDAVLLPRFLRALVTTFAA